MKLLAWSCWALATVAVYLTLSSEILDWIFWRKY